MLILPLGLFGYFLFSVTQLGNAPIYMEQIERYPSPDSVMDAVLMKIGGGLTTTTDVYALYIVLRGDIVSKKEGAVFSAVNIEGLRCRWKTPKLLVIQYREGKIEYFRNYWSEIDVKDPRYAVEIQLAKGND